MRLLATIALLALSGCMCHLASRYTTVEHVGTPAAGADTVIAVAREMAPPGSRPLVGRVRWVEDFFLCGAVQAQGCSHGVCFLDATVKRIEPATSSALAFEVGHYFWQAAYGRNGETRAPDGKITADADLAAWTARVNAEAARRRTQ